MPPSPRRLVAGNWKMNGTSHALHEAEAVACALTDRPAASRVAICPPATLIHRMAELVGPAHVEVGAQDCRAEREGAYTGDLGAEMLHDAGATLVILGHSERRTGHRESDVVVADKVRAALRAGLEPIVCVGETLEERRAGGALDVVRGQLAASLPAEVAGRAFSIAYEPVWAIGSGLTPTLAEIEAVHRAIRESLAALDPRTAAPILYGGSVKPANAAEIMAVPEVGGALVGGASLTAAGFLPIVRAAG